MRTLCLYLTDSQALKLQAESTILGLPIASVIERALAMYFAGRPEVTEESETTMTSAAFLRAMELNSPSCIIGSRGDLFVSENTVAYRLLLEGGKKADWTFLLGDSVEESADEIAAIDLLVPLQSKTHSITTDCGAVSVVPNMNRTELSVLAGKAGEVPTWLHCDENLENILRAVPKLTGH